MRSWVIGTLFLTSLITGGLLALAVLVPTPTGPGQAEDMTPRRKYGSSG